jgi:hypothetical protein
MRPLNRENPKPDPLRVPLVRTRDEELMLRRVAARPEDGRRMPPRKR